MIGYGWIGRVRLIVRNRLQDATWPPSVLPRLVAICGRREAGCERRPNAGDTRATTPTGATIADGYKAALVAEAARQSSREDRRIVVSSLEQV